MTTGTADRAVGPDYWFVDPAYWGIDRLTEDECPLDEIERAREWDELDRTVAANHSRGCWGTVSIGEHHPDNCPMPGVK